MKFKKWIRAQGGSKVLARRLGFESPTINHWINGTSTPKALVMQKLVRMGKGAFNYDDIINETKKSKGV